jgi:O-antigen/teichoic acid export membrane protein
VKGIELDSPLDSQEETILSPPKTAPILPPDSDSMRARGMDKSLAHSLTWRAVTNWGSQILAWASLLVVVRLLAPSDFGIVAMSVVLWPYLRYLGEFGIPQTVVTLRDLTDDQLGQLNTVASLLGLACFAISFALAYPLAAFSGRPLS